MPKGYWRKTTVSMLGLYDFLKSKGNYSPNTDQLIDGYYDYCRDLLDGIYAGTGKDRLFYSFKTPFPIEENYSFLNEGVAGEIYEFENAEDRAIYEQIVLKNGAFDKFLEEIECKKYRYGEKP